MDKGTSAVCMGVVGAAVAASIYVLWGPDNLLLRRKGEFIGLPGVHGILHDIQASVRACRISGTRAS